jgi:hypothetical protein
MDNSKNRPKLRMTTKQEIAHQFSVSYNTILRRFKMLGIDTKRQLVSPKQLEIFYEAYGYPG